MQTTDEIFADRVFGFTIPSRNARGRAVRLDGVLDEILSAHEYPAAITHLLAEALVLSSLIGGLIKHDEGQMTMQAQTQGGVVKLLACDFKNGAVRGYVDFDRDRLESLGANPSLAALFGEGYLAMTFDMADKRGRYQGIVPLEGESLSEACEAYFVQSEQLPTLIRVAVRSSENSCIAAGMLVQHLADGEQGRERLHVRLDHPEWEHVSVMAGSLRHEELLDRDLSMEALVWRLFHEEDAVRRQPGPVLTRGCRCSSSHYKDVLGRFPENERAEMRNDDGEIVVDCAFCSKTFVIDL
ncbi:Hsp33 family molecular chaperone HslO [Altererythrobacter sp.]|nr:Hsp33 family molecular chaperone HslO [Altererythrobacter sp.]